MGRKRRKAFLERAYCYLYVTVKALVIEHNFQAEITLDSFEFHQGILASGGQAFGVLNSAELGVPWHSDGLNWGFPGVLMGSVSLLCLSLVS